jgi:hypothetical protein
MMDKDEMKKTLAELADYRSRKFDVRIVENREEDIEEFRIETTHNGWQYLCTHCLNSIEMMFLYEKLTEHLAKTKNLK